MHLFTGEKGKIVVWRRTSFRAINHLEGRTQIGVEGVINLGFRATNARRKPSISLQKNPGTPVIRVKSYQKTVMKKKS